MVEDSELAAGQRYASTSFSTQRLPQELDLTISIDLEISTRIAVEMASRKDVQLLGFSGFCERLEGDVSRTKHIIFGHGHQQRSRRDTMDHMRRVVGAKQLDAVKCQSLVSLMSDCTEGETRPVPFHGDFILPSGLCFPCREELIRVRSRQGRWLRGIFVNYWYDGSLFARGSSFTVFSLSAAVRKRLHATEL
jgi:hypothetical protein